MSQGTTKRGSYSVGRKRRGHIIDVAAQYFASQGYSNTSLAEIARQVGLTTPGVTHHFPTKQHLLLAIVEQRFDVAESFAAASEGPLDGTRTLGLLLELTHLLIAQPGLMELFVRVSAEAADPDSPAHELFAERYERVTAQIAALFQAEAQAGFLRTDIDYHAVARECIAVSDGLQLQWVVSRGKIDLVAQINTHLQRLGDSLRP
ncbi:TetR/AcrR family transcriptional regulator [Glutamicibacter sp. MNS18]|uniref:TetR/AcrR family transcriptional regulator n=1 Tax=Glutamicibacter sp. MNS18 TaxID=2989817 RepID=UPI002236A369|nr:TetR/AcrR family transcriptional regulator [Glutamicibacter sp. MNS18]MCW4465426.1 TetR/AcrR family transcriptional regulator [Glutamicibacter sp. MNS18]